MGNAVRVSIFIWDKSASTLVVKMCISRNRDTEFCYFVRHQKMRLDSLKYCLYKTTLLRHNFNHLVAVIRILMTNQELMRSVNT